MEEKSNRKPYAAPCVNVYEMEPIQVMAGSINNSVDVGDWGNGGTIPTGYADPQQYDPLFELFE